jgi:hypothetical protein
MNLDYKYDKSKNEECLRKLIRLACQEDAIQVLLLESFYNLR